MSGNKKKNFNKREEFVEKKNNSNLYIMIACLAAALIIIGYIVYPKSQSSSASSSGRLKNVGAVTYDSNLEMTGIKATVANGQIAIPLASVQKSKLVTFTYDKNQVDTGFGKQGLPLLAYIAPSGDVVTAVSMCEPCKSVKFHIESDNTLTCNTCGTKFDAQTLKGVSGGCTDYPPDEVKYQVKNGNILINESEVASWKPRV